jgi:hypothetical protein
MGNYFASEDRGKPKLRSLSPPMHLLGPTTSLHGTHPPGVELEPLDLPVPPPPHQRSQSVNRPPAGAERVRPAPATADPAAHATASGVAGAGAPARPDPSRLVRPHRTSRSEQLLLWPPPRRSPLPPPRPPRAPISSSCPRPSLSQSLPPPLATAPPVSSSSRGRRATDLFLLSGSWLGARRPVRALLPGLPPPAHCAYCCWRWR